MALMDLKVATISTVNAYAPRLPRNLLMGASWFLAGVPLANNYRLVRYSESYSESIIPLGIIVLADERGISMTQCLGAWLRRDWG